jgi:hypothetical protein
VLLEGVIYWLFVEPDMCWNAARPIFMSVFHHCENDLLAIFKKDRLKGNSSWSGDQSAGGSLNSTSYGGYPPVVIVKKLIFLFIITPDI